jgi:hypothetical protein
VIEVTDAVFIHNPDRSSIELQDAFIPARLLTVLFFDVSKGSRMSVTIAPKAFEIELDTGMASVKKMLFADAAAFEITALEPPML